MPSAWDVHEPSSGAVQWIPSTPGEHTRAEPTWSWPWDEEVRAEASAQANES